MVPSGTIGDVPSSPDQTLRCTASSRLVGEPLAGTAPTESAYLLVEYAGAWGRKAVAESRLPEEVRTALAGLHGVRVQLIRRHGGTSGPGVRVFTALVGPDRVEIETTVLDEATGLLDLDLAALEAGRSPGLTPYAGRAAAGLHQRPPGPVLRRARPSGDRGAGGPLARGDLGDHPPGRPPVLRHPAGPAQRE